MEICSHLMSEISINDLEEEELTQVAPRTPVLAPIDAPTEILESM
jgi:hypothetical protein